MKRRSVSREERELWCRAVRDVSPLRATLSIEASPDRPARAPATVISSYRSPGQAEATTVSVRHFVFGGGDPRLDRAAANRRIAIERTLDLHGMTQVEAHRAMLRFMASAAADGARLVLVITGKGGARAPGVLKSRFLDWVEAPPLKGEIARVSPAKQKDGGAGAFYVFLKRKGAGLSPRL